MAINYFDHLATRPLTFAPTDTPLPAFMAASAPSATVQFQQPQMVAPKQAVADPWAGLEDDGEFVDLGGAPAEAAQPQQPQAQQPAGQPMAAPTNNSVDAAGWDAAKTEQARQEIARLINSGATRDQIVAHAANYGKTAADLAGLDAALAYRDAHQGAAIPVGIQTPQAQAQAQPEPYHAEDRGRLEATLDGVADSVLMGGKDELAGALRASANSVANVIGNGTGESWSEAYARERDAERQVSRDADYHHGGYRMGGQLIGGLATLPLGGEAALAAGGRQALLRLAGEGAALGGVYGFNSADGDISDRLTDAAKGAALGAAGGVIVGGPANALANRLTANRAVPTAGARILQAADNLTSGNEAAGGAAVRPLVGHTSDGGFGSQLTTMLQPTISGGARLTGGLNHAVEGFEQQAGATAQRIANDAAGGQAPDLVTAAARANDPNVRGSLGAYATDTETAARAVYGAAETAANGAQVPTPSTIGRIDEILAEWRAVPGGVPGAETLQNLRNQLAQGPDGGSTSAAWTIDGLRRLRTSFGDNIEAGQRQLREAANRLWGPLSDDIFRGLGVAGQPDAARLYRQADRQWAQRAAGMEVIQRVIGRDADLSADAVAQRLSSMAGKDYDHLGQALNLIDPTQAAGIRGGLISKLGEALPSRATTPGEFSLESFATRWAKMSDQARAAMFAPQTVRDLNDLATLAGSNRAMQRTGNPSRSGILNENWRQLRAISVEGAALAGGATWNPAVWLGFLGAAATGRLLATPGFARLLVRAGQSRKTELVARRLGEIARRNPAVAQDIAGFRDAMAGRVPAHAVTIHYGTRHQEADPFAGLPDDGQYVDLN
jgi:predicted phage tail protein